MADVVQESIILPPELSGLSVLVEQKPECFASGSKDVQSAALNATKYIFDLAIQSEAQSKPYIVDLLSSLTPSTAPETRSQSRENGGNKRKRSSIPPNAPLNTAFELTPLTSLFVDGMDDDQIWEQLDLRARKLCQTLEAVLEGEPEDDIEGIMDEEGRKLLRALQSGQGLEEFDLGDLEEMLLDDDNGFSEDSEENFVEEDASENGEDEEGEDDKDENEDEDGEDDVDEDELEFKGMELDEIDDGSNGVEDDSEGDGGRKAIKRLKDDLFADEEQEPSNLSTYEKRMADLREQILTLESENVGKKDWVLMGEASSRNRPQNSLLEEDLEFERVMKAVPIITEEVVQGLEERIKERILEGQFDDVVRIRAAKDKPFLPSRLFELQDSKSAQSLAQIYEDEYSAAQNGGPTGDDRDGKLKKEHDEIEMLWESISSKLDALCNAHFVPKQPKATISTLSNVAVTSLESALPTSKSVSTMLAPEEVFTPASSDLRARSELTPTEKRALRNKERKARKKTRDSLEKSVDKFSRKLKGVGSIKKQKQAALESVVKNGKGVTVVGKKNKGKKTDKIP